MNLKSDYLLKKLLKWANKKCKNFNIYNVFEKTKKNFWRYHYFTPVYQKTSLEMQIVFWFTGLFNIFLLRVLIFYLMLGIYE